jgi:hypothetical protein
LRLADAEFTQLGAKIIGSTQWLAPADVVHERFQVLTMRNDKVVDMQRCASRREAVRFARRHEDLDERRERTRRVPSTAEGAAGR